MNVTSTSDAAHAFDSSAATPRVAYWKIYRGTKPMASLGDNVRLSLPKAVHSNGAVSPAMRAMARNTPVMIAERAAGTATRSTVCQ